MLVRELIAAALALAVAGSAGAATIIGAPKADFEASLALDPSLDSGAPSSIVLDFPTADLGASGGGDPLELYRRNSHTGRDVDLGAGVASVPEPMAWTMMIAGVGLAGAVLRRRRGRTSLN